MIHQSFRLPINNRVQVPEIVDLDQVRVIAGGDKFRIVLQKEVRHVVPVQQLIERRRPQPLRLQSS
jgi:hypothetical protein